MVDKRRISTLGGPVIDEAARLRRDGMIAKFRREVYARNDIIPFVHQAEWQLASEGWTLVDAIPTPGQASREILLPRDLIHDGDVILREETVNEIPCVVCPRVIVPRIGGAAHVVSDMAAYKQGKSFGVGLWAAGFACVPGKVEFIGLEYGTSEHEFNYLVEALCSERGMNMTPLKYQNDKRGGRMILKLKTGMTYEVKSWDNKESLKGAKILAYIYTEAYMLPGLEVFTTVSQNLRQLRGWASFSTTPDRPWVGIFHDEGHGKNLDWHCTCGVDGTANPFTFDLRAMMRDAPNWELLPPSVVLMAKRLGLEPGKLMTKERFMIAWLGRLGKFVGRVYEFQRGTRLISPITHPDIFDPDLVTQYLGSILAPA